jgi:hypothetical protein
MSRANTIVVPGGKMELAMQLIFTPFIWRMMERQEKSGLIGCSVKIHNPHPSSKAMTTTPTPEFARQMANAIRMLCR